MADKKWYVLRVISGKERKLKEYIELLQSRHQVQINLLVDKNVDTIQLNMEMRKDIFWLFKNGITNVVRSGGNNNRIHIRYEKPSLTYLLEFDTAGINREELNNLRQRKELADKLTVLDASIHFSEQTGTASFILTIPVK